MKMTAMWRTFAVGALFGALAVLACWLWPPSLIGAALICNGSVLAGITAGGMMDVRAAALKAAKQGGRWR